MFIIILIILIIVLVYIIQKKSNSPTLVQNNTEKNDLEEEKIDYKKYYTPKVFVTTLNELKFYNILLEIAKEMDLILFSQVSLYNIVSMKKDLDFSTHKKYFNKIASKTIDFVLVDKKNCRIKLCIELDDSTHNQPKRIKRDIFINELFESLEINLLRYPVYNVYYKEPLKKKIKENMKEHYYTKL